MGPGVASQRYTRAHDRRWRRTQPAEAYRVPSVYGMASEPDRPGGRATATTTVTANEYPTG